MNVTENNNKCAKSILEEIEKNPYHKDGVSELADKLANMYNYIIVFAKEGKVYIKGKKNYEGIMLSSKPVKIHVEELEPFVITGYEKHRATLDMLNDEPKYPYYLFGTFLPCTPFFLYANKEDYENKIPSCRGIIVDLDIMFYYDYPAISCDDFKKSMDAIKAVNKKSDDFNKALNKYSDSYCAINLHSELEAQFIAIFNKIFGLKENDDIISWWLYENVKKELYEDDYTYDVESPEDFYEYLCSQSLFNLEKDDSDAD